MGLREQNARRTRSTIAEVALVLFEERGYEATTMEQIAGAADVGTSTLYRYFPTKDSLLLEHPVLDVRPIADLLAGRPVDEPVDVALGQALAAHLAALDAGIEEIARVRLQIDRNPAVRARTWDVWGRQRTLLEQVLADRLDTAPEALETQVVAHIIQMIIQMAMDQTRAVISPESPVVYAERVVDLLSSGAVPLPRMPAKPPGRDWTMVRRAARGGESNV